MLDIDSLMSRWQAAAPGSGEEMAVTSAADSFGSFSIARVARRRTLTTRSLVVSPLGGRFVTRCSSSRTQRTWAAASRWSLEEK